MSKISLLISSLFYLSITTAFAGSFSLHSPSFSDMSNLDPIYTCDGKNISPKLEWDNAPSQTVSFALILSDPDAPGGTFYHWVLFNIPKAVTSLAENVSNLPAGTQAGMNSWEKIQYSGPCPPRGSQHQYIFSLYALDTKLDIPNGADAKTLLNAMKNHIVSVSELKPVFGH